MHKGSDQLYSAPVLIYDNHCRSCTKFAEISVKLSRGRIYATGHYTAEGMRIKGRTFPKQFSAESMFWLITENGAFGGRSGLLPLTHEIAKGFLGIGERAGAKSEENAIYEDLCIAQQPGCSTPRGFFSRLGGLLCNGQKFEQVNHESL